MENRPIDQCGQLWIRALVVFGNLRLCMVGGVAQKIRWACNILSREPTVVHDGGTPSVTGLPHGAQALHVLTGADAEEEPDGYA
jgi:hypothetical protein